VPISTRTLLLSQEPLAYMASRPPPRKNGCWSPFKILRATTTIASEAAMRRNENGGHQRVSHCRNEG
jgi:hypothetical protein